MSFISPTLEVESQGTWWNKQDPTMDQNLTRDLLILVPPVTRSLGEEASWSYRHLAFLKFAKTCVWVKALPSPLSPSWFQGVLAGKANNPKWLQGSVDPVRLISDCSEECLVSHRVYIAAIFSETEFLPKFSCIQCVLSIEDQLWSDHLSGPRLCQDKWSKLGRWSKELLALWCFGISLVSRSPEKEEPLETKITGEWGLPSNLGESLKVDDIGQENGEVSSCFFFPIPTISHFPLTFG